MSRKDEIAQRLSAVRSTLNPNVELIVVTKTFPLSDVEILFDLGERHFGENRDSEGAESAHISPDAIWHFQGGIQSNKLKSIVAWSDYIHSLDEIRHAVKISQIAFNLGKIQKCFIQVNLDGDLNDGHRSGIPPQQLAGFISQVKELPGLQIVGVMGVGPLNGDSEAAFAQLRECSQLLRNEIPAATFISAGMSGDYQIAIKHGATHVRLGSSILGTR